MWVGRIVTGMTGCLVIGLGDVGLCWSVVVIGVSGIWVAAFSVVSVLLMLIIFAEVMIIRSLICVACVPRTIGVSLLVRGGLSVRSC